MTNKTVTVTIVAIKTDWTAPSYKLHIDGEEAAFNPAASNLLTGTVAYHNAGIFNPINCDSRFEIDDTRLWVDFGSPWAVEKYKNPALEIARRVQIVAAAFDAARESYERTYTVTI